MAESNYAALTEGLKLYTDAMRGFIKERLIRAYPNDWWESGVVKSLRDQHRTSVGRDIRNNPTKDKLDFIEPSHFPNIIGRNFNNAFQGVFGDYRKTQAWLNQIAIARNDWAHPRSGDMLAKEVAQALYGMFQLLSVAKLLEAGPLERLRKELSGIDPVPSQVVPPPDVRVARSGELPYWWQVCEPHDGFQNPASIDEALFAATLGLVHAGAGRDEYLRPDIFFAHTYFTENLKQTVRDVASRLSGGDGPSVIEMQTPFGGGKTHALLALYHLIKNPEASFAVAGVREALADVSIPASARVLVFDGQEYGTEPWLKENGAAISTIWGELAFQADPSLFNRLLVASDSRGEAPGNMTYRQVLEGASPCLIVIDELVSYLVKLRFSSVRRTQNLYHQTIQFLQETLQQVGNVPGTCVLLSLPQSKREFGGIDPQKLQRQLEDSQREFEVLEDLQPRTNRVVSKRTPVNDEEIYTLTSKRLFKKTDPEVAKQVAHMYRETYERTRGLYDQTVLSAEYLQQQQAAYPLHPELIDVLYKKWSTASDFPRTRAVLQLLANVVADQWVNRREAYSIQSAHVNLDRERIRTRIVSAVGAGGGYDAVVAADIIGGDAHADMIDQRRGGEYERYHIARGIATTVLMHSFGGATRTGVLPQELRLGTVAPNVGPEYVTEVIDNLEQSLWYVHREGDLLRFQTKANIYRIIAQSAEGQSAASTESRLRDEMQNAIGQAEGFRVLAWAGTDGNIADDPQPSIAVLDPRQAVEENGGPVPNGRERIVQLWERKSGGGLRQWRNSMVLVAPDSELWSRAIEATREVMAYEAVLDSASRGTLELSQRERQELTSRLKDKKDSLRTSLVTAYRWVFYPDEDGLTAVGLPVPATASERIVDRVVKRLSAQDYGHPKIMATMGAIYFNSKLAPRLWKDESAPLDLEETRGRFRQWTYLPILPKREETLRACIRDGLVNNLWAVVIGDNTTSTYRRLIEKPAELDDVPELFDGSASLAKGDLLELIREELAKVGGVVPQGGGLPFPPATPPQGPPVPEPPVIPPPARRLARVRIRLDRLPIAKTTNLQQYLFRVLQEQDAGAELVLTIEVNSAAGISTEALEKRIVDGFDMLGIDVKWEPI